MWVVYTKKSFGFLRLKYAHDFEFFLNNLVQFIDFIKHCVIGLFYAPLWINISMHLGIIFLHLSKLRGEEKFIAKPIQPNLNSGGVYFY